MRLSTVFLAFFSCWCCQVLAQTAPAAPVQAPDSSNAAVSKVKVQPTCKIFLKGGSVVLGAAVQFDDQQLNYINPSDSARYSLPSALIDRIERIDEQQLSAAPQPPSPPAPVAQKAKVPVIPVRFGPFDFKNSFEFGTGLSYFFYREKIPVADIAGSVEPGIITGQPKSVESGFLPVLHAGYQWIFPKSHIFLKPSETVFLGIGNTYDGSTQAQSNGVGVVFEPKTMQKDNYFFHTLLDGGYFFSSEKNAFALYSGLNIKIWSRDLSPAEKQPIDYYGQVAYVRTESSETYSSFSLPLGCSYYWSLSPRWWIGVNGVLDLMVHGTMASSQTYIVEDQYGSELDRLSPSFPNVTLGNHAQYAMGFIVQGWLTDKISLRFAPYVKTCSFGKSNTATATIQGMPALTFHEPESGTLFGGVSVTMSVAWDPLFSKPKETETAVR